jgi:S-(hydroxymethyl)glutathione dehydrogenase / alcohol dehydrogenase
MPPILKTRAAVMHEFGAPLVIEEIELKPPADDEVIVKMAASGICGTDLSVIHCNLPYPPPVVLGHEGAGVVEWAGPDVKHVAVGDHVVLSVTHECGTCGYCSRGIENLCERTVKAVEELQDLAFTKDGVDIGRFCGIASFAERSAVRGYQCIKIDKNAPLERACLVGCAVVTGVGAVINKAKVQPGQSVAVFGCGGVGLNVIQGAVIAGAGAVIAVDLDTEKLQKACEFGATAILDPTTVADVAGAIAVLNGGIGVDFAFECAGLPELMQQAFFATRRGGSAVVVGVAPFGVDVSVPACMLGLQERSLVGSLYGSGRMQRDVPALLDLYTDGKLKLDELVTREVPLEQINEAIAAMQSGTGIRHVVVHD